MNIYIYLRKAVILNFSDLWYLKKINLFMKLYAVTLGNGQKVSDDLECTSVIFSTEEVVGWKSI